MKSFFKSNAFKSVVVLLVIALVSGILLSVFNDVLYVSAEERLARTLSKIYGQSVDTSKVREIPVEEEQKTNAYGSVELVYLLEDGNYLIKSSGVGGFKNGTVTLWTVLDCDGSFDDGTLDWKGVGKVVYETNKSQTYITKTTGMYAEFALHNDELINGAVFSTMSSEGIQNLTAGASFSSAAINNAVNAAITYFRNVYLGTKNTYRFEDYIDVAASSATVAGEHVEYALTIKTNMPAKQFKIEIAVENGAISSYEIKENGSTKDYIKNMPSEIKDGTLFVGKNETTILTLLNEKGALTQESGLLGTNATKSVESCVRAAAFAVCNYALVKEQGGLL